MTLTEELEAKIRRLHHAEHWPVGTIAAQLDVHHEAVRHALGLGARPASPPRPKVMCCPSRIATSSPCW